MENPYIVREKAIRLAVRTGIAPDLDFVWEAQELEGGPRCFGSFNSTCPYSCQWFDRCQQLSAEPIETQLPEPRVELTANRTIPLRMSQHRWRPPYLRQTSVSVQRTPPL